MKEEEGKKKGRLGGLGLDLKRRKKNEGWKKGRRKRRKRRRGFEVLIFE